MRTRRDHKKYLGLIRAIAFLYKRQSLDELARPSKTLLSAIYNMVKEIADKQDIPIDQVYFTRRDVREYTGWTDWQVKIHIKQLKELEYLHVQIGAQGKKYSYALNYQGQGEESNKCYLNLTPVSEIRKLMKRDKEKDKEED